MFDSCSHCTITDGTERSLLSDKLLGRELAEPSLDLCDDGHLVFFAHASHWPHDEEPTRVNSLLLGFLEGNDATVEADRLSYS